MVTRTASAGVGRQAVNAPFGWGRAWQHARRMIDARRTRQLLAELDGRLLADVGIAPGDAQMEAARPFWDLATRRR